MKTSSAIRIIRSARAKLTRRGFGPCGLAFTAANRDRPYPWLDHRPHQVNMEQPIVEPGAAHLDPLGKHEGALELARRDAAMQINALAVIGLLQDRKSVV